MAPSAQAFQYPQPTPVSTATWNGTNTLTDTVTSGGALIASFAGQYGNPS